jgi:LPS-assembly protein
LVTGRFGLAEVKGAPEAHSSAKSCRLCAPGVRALLMIGAAVLAFCASEAAAAPAKDPSAPRKASTAVPVDDGLGQSDIYMEADTVADDRNSKLVTAEGHVEVRYQGRTLRADKVVYNAVTGESHAIGHVVIIGAEGTQYSNDMVLDDQFRAAVSLGFSARLQDNVTMVAGASIRRNDAVSELKNGIVTPCAICKSDGVTPKKPTFYIQADDIVQDREKQLIYYHHAIIRVAGIPIFYAPIFWHPDPSSPRSSGLLAPKFQYSKRRGFSYTQPYYWAISPSADLTVSPQLNTAVNPFVNMRYREQFYSGSIDIRAGYTYDQEFDSDRKFGDDTSRSYILAKGAFQLDPQWIVGFGAERVTDPTLFQRYTVSQVYSDRGPFPTDTSRLISQLYANRVDANSYFSAGIMSFESLRAAVLDNGTQVGVQSYDTSAAFPVVPVVEEHWDPTEGIFGGRLRLTGSAVALYRNNPVIAVDDPEGLQAAGPQPYSYHGQVTFQNSLGQSAPPLATPGDPISSLIYRDSRRASAEANWQSSVTFDSGIRIQPFVDARFDYFSINDARLQTATTLDLTPTAENDTRGLGSVGATISWPFIKPIGANGSLIIEPIAQFIAANRVKLDKNIPDEDSVSFEFDETNLFALNRFSGYDLAEGGDRANLGVRASLDLPGGTSASALIGRAFRTETDDAFTPQSGLAGTSSDWVTAVSVTPISGLTLFNRARLDGSNWTVRREEAGANLYFGQNFSANLRYVYEQSGLVQVSCAIQDVVLVNDVAECPSPFGGSPVAQGSSVIGKVENAQIGASWFFTKNWGVTVNADYDFVGYETNGRYHPVLPISQLGLVYKDDCVRLDIIYTHDQTYSATIGSSDSIGFRLTLTTLGSTFGPQNRGSAQGSR